MKTETENANSTKIDNEIVSDFVVNDNPVNDPANVTVVNPEENKKFQGNKRGFKKNKKTPLRGKPQRSEFDQRILNIRRVTRVAAGGRRFSFSVAIVIGNGKGKIGVGTGKASDTSLAIEKAVKNARKKLIEVKLTNTNSIPHMVRAKYSSADVRIQPSPGHGIVAGSSVRDLVELGGITDVVGKILSGSKNKLNIAQATIKAFNTLNEPKSHESKKENSKSINNKAIKQQS